jgi:D-alanine transaminase
VEPVADVDPLVYFRSSDVPDGALLPKRLARISPDDRGFLFGDGVYEVIRSYSGRLFRSRDHLARLGRSLAAVRIAVTGVDFEAVAADLLRRNKLDSGDAVVYIQVTRGILERMRNLPEQPLFPTVYVEASPLSSERALVDGVAVATQPDIRWQRCDIKATSLLPSVLGRLHAADRSVYETVYIRDGLVTEGTHTNVFGVRDRAVHTHPADNHILAGITRTVVLELCASLDINVNEKAIRESGLGKLDELFLACTTGEVIPVLSVDGRPVADGKPGPVTRRLQESFRAYAVRTIDGTVR